MLEQENIRALIEKVRFNLSLKEILFNCRIFAKFMLEKSKILSFSLKPIQVRPLFESDQEYSTRKNEQLSKVDKEKPLKKSKD
jgi:hypothetical protein